MVLGTALTSIFFPCWRYCCIALRQAQCKLHWKVVAFHGGESWNSQTSAGVIVPCTVRIKAYPPMFCGFCAMASSMRCVSLSLPPSLPPLPPSLPPSLSPNTWAGFQCVHLWASEVEFAATRTATFGGICGVGFLVLWCWWSNCTRSMIPWWPILQQWFEHPQNPAADLYAAPFRALTLYPRSPWRLRFANGPISDGRLVDLVSFVIISRSQFLAV